MNGQCFWPGCWRRKRLAGERQGDWAASLPDMWGVAAAAPCGASPPCRANSPCERAAGAVPWVGIKGQARHSEEGALSELAEGVLGLLLETPGLVLQEDCSILARGPLACLAWVACLATRGLSRPALGPAHEKGGDPGHNPWCQISGLGARGPGSAVAWATPPSGHSGCGRDGLQGQGTYQRGLLTETVATASGSSSAPAGLQYSWF